MFDVVMTVSADEETIRYEYDGDTLTLPIVEGRRGRRGEFELTCPFCGKRHIHGAFSEAQEGPRLAHCDRALSHRAELDARIAASPFSCSIRPDRSSPFYDAPGYYIRPRGAVGPYLPWGELRPAPWVEAAPAEPVPPRSTSPTTPPPYLTTYSVDGAARTITYRGQDRELRMPIVLMAYTFCGDDDWYCTVGCPYCGEEHEHRAVEGTRIAHCADVPLGASSPREYYIRTPSETLPYLDYGRSRVPDFLLTLAIAKPQDGEPEDAYEETIAEIARTGSRTGGWPT